MDLPERFLYLFANNGRGNICKCTFNNPHENRIQLNIQATHFFTRRFIPMNVALSQECVFAIGDKDSKKFEIIDLRANYSTTSINGLSPTIWHRGACVAHNRTKLFYIGSRNNNGYCTVQAFDGIQWKTEKEKSPAQIDLDSHSSVFHCDDRLYVIDPHERAIFCMAEDGARWSTSPVGHTLTQRYGAGVVSNNGKIYITGGLNGKIVQRSCESFDNSPRVPIPRKRVKLAKMKRPRYLHSLVAYENKIYAVGGYKKFIDEKPMDFCSDVEEYDPILNQWRIVGSCSEPGSNNNEP